MSAHDSPSPFAYCSRMDRRTIADLRAAGFDGLRIACPGCRKITIHWWQTLGVSDDTTLERITKRLRCSQCAAVPSATDVRPYRKSDDQPPVTGHMPPEARAEAARRRIEAAAGPSVRQYMDEDREDEALARTIQET